MRFDHRAVPIAVLAMLIDSIGFGIVLPVLPSLIVELGGVSLAQGARIGSVLRPGDDREPAVGRAHDTHARELRGAAIRGKSAP